MEFVLASSTLFLPWLVVFVLTSGYRWFSQNKSVAAVVTLVASVLQSIAALILLFGFAWEKGREALIPWISLGSIEITFGLRLDSLSVMVAMVVATVVFAIQLFARWYMAEDVGFVRFFIYLNIFVSAMIGLVFSPNLLQLFLFWELMGVCSFLLIGFWYDKPLPIFASKKAFLTTRFADTGIVLGAFALLHYLGTLSFSHLPERLEEAHLPIALVTIIVLLLFMGVMGKSAQFPLHIWLPDAMAGPTPSSALIHAATMVAAGVYLLARISPLVEHAPFAGYIIMLIGSITIVVGAFHGLWQSDIKKVLAYSTISQLGYMVLGAGAGAFGASVFHLATHAYFKALLFLTAGGIIHILHDQDMFTMGGLGKHLKKITAVFLVGSASLMGIFPFSGFWSKDEIVLAVSTKGITLPFILALIGVLLTSLYATRQCLLVFAGEYRGKGHMHELPRYAFGALAYTAVTSLVIGLLGTPFANKIAEFVGHSFEHAEHHKPDYMLMLGSTVIIFAGVSFMYILYRRGALDKKPNLARIPILHQIVDLGWGVDATVRYGVVPCLHTFSTWCNWFDKNAIDAVVVGFAGAVRMLSRGLLLVEKYCIDGLVLAFGWAQYAFAGVSLRFDLSAIDGVVVGLGKVPGVFGAIARKLQNGQTQVYVGVMLAVTTLLLLFILFTSSVLAS